MLDWLMADTRFPYVLASLLVASGLLALWTGVLAAGRVLGGARPTARRLGVLALVLGGLNAAVPFFGTGFAMTALAFDLLLLANNLERMWLAQAVGPEQYDAFLLRAAGGGRLGLGLVGFLGAGLVVAALGGLLLMLSPNGSADWSYWIGLGVLCFGVLLALRKVAYLLSLHRRSARIGASVA